MLINSNQVYITEDEVLFTGVCSCLYQEYVAEDEVYIKRSALLTCAVFIRIHVHRSLHQRGKVLRRVLFTSALVCILVRTIVGIVV